MKEFVPIILVVSFICGLGGTLIAKSARKKSSYPLLIFSGILAVLTLVGVIASAVIIFFVK